MKKSKRKQKIREEERRRAKDQFYNWATAAMDDARDFLETATPFEISLELAKIGVSTTNREGIERLLDQAIDRLVQYELSSQQIVQGFLTHLLNVWKAELRAKGRECSTEDFVFLAEAARIYATPWVRKNQLKQELEQVKAVAAQPGLTSGQPAAYADSSACVTKRFSQS